MVTFAPAVPAALPRYSPPEEADKVYLRERLVKPQRHRLLHGYPLAAAMHSHNESSPVEVTFNEDDRRGLLVGVLPHPFCNPAVTGCGYCTFPHETYHAERAEEVVKYVVQEIDGRLARQPQLHRRRIAGLYFGGGTANLTPADSFRRLCRRLATAFDLSGAEVTLEGVPSYFIKRKPLLMDVMQEEIGARHFRLSMGVQTFDEERLRQMGRLAFGTAETFAQVVETAHCRGFTVSADLLFNLPGQSLNEMLRDVQHAVRIGLDHLGLYHLVMFRGLGTVWSRDPALLAALPANAQAAENWLALRQKMLEEDFLQTTLTNFEHTRCQGSQRRFVYEEFSFQPDRYDMAGFGPGAISFAAAQSFTGGLKVVNPDAATSYVNAVRRGRPPSDRSFAYDPMDLRIFYLTRRLAALEINRRDYARLFQTDLLADFAGAFAALSREGLVEVAPSAIRPTPRGMFYADSIAALFAWRQIEARRGAGSSRSLPMVPGQAEERHRGVNDNSRGHM